MATNIFIWMLVVGVTSIACDTNTVTESLKLTDPSGKPGHRFGEDMASCNDLVIVGSFDTDQVTIYKQSRRTFTNVTNLPQQRASEKFANAVACNDQFLVFVSRRNKIHIHLASEPYSQVHIIESHFRSMSKIRIDNNNNIYLSNAYNRKGIVKIYSYTYNWWNEVNFLHSPRTDAYYFGLDIVVTSKHLVVTSPWTNYSQRGAVFVYDKSSTNRVLLQIITSPTPKAGEEFGTSVALDGDWMVVGTDDRLAYIKEKGFAYIYQYVSQNTYKHTQTLKSPYIEGVKFTRFGRLVSIKDNDCCLWVCARK